MPLHSVTQLSDCALLGLWHLQELAPELIEQLPYPERYAELQPVGRDTTRATQWLAGRVLAHALLRQLTTSAPPLLRNDANGRPFCEHLPELAVSLSHSGKWVAAIVATKGSLGIDIELVRPKAQKLASRFLSEAEQADAGDETTKYSLYWSAKETLYKLHSRRGLVFKEQIKLDPFRLREAGVLTGHLLLENSRSQHQIHYTCPVAGYVLTYCHEMLNVAS
ncbi:4'-phosphopantetheinyl transferase superfamily protein [Hymenobacter cavernae]|uniref:Enterobactin synthase component D n=1 Tax=Hymenobacter cavernae TaxID=2044852 RepID=A0ABQ1TH30_9BACT|nr:4'-phosphopantetheinyl transferase superfamily protein [Hymenobacter cavernae]GGE95362.1 4'-phosphopantetheinyl transferase [Hymenobacter cavernae]